MTHTDTCPGCLTRGIQPADRRQWGERTVHAYRCRCSHQWTVSRHTPAYPTTRRTAA